MATGRLDLGDGWSTTVDLEIKLGDDGGFEFGAMDLTEMTKKGGAVDGLARFGEDSDRVNKIEGGGGDIDKIWLGNSSRVMDGADSKAARFELGNSLDADDVMKLISGEISDDNILVETTNDGVKITFQNAKNGSVADVLNISFDFVEGVDTKPFVNDSGNAETETTVLASGSGNGAALLGYAKNIGGEGAKEKTAYDVVTNSLIASGDLPAGERQLREDLYEVKLESTTSISETYALTTIETGATDYITFIDNVAGADGLFDLGV